LVPLVARTSHAHLNGMASTVSLVGFYLLVFLPAYAAFVWTLVKLSG